MRHLKNLFNKKWIPKHYNEFILKQNNMIRDPSSKLVRCDNKYTRICLLKSTEDSKIVFTENFDTFIRKVEHKYPKPRFSKYSTH